MNLLTFNFFTVDITMTTESLKNAPSPRTLQRLGMVLEILFFLNHRHA